MSDNIITFPPQEPRAPIWPEPTEAEATARIARKVIGDLLNQGVSPHGLATIALAMLAVCRELDLKAKADRILGPRGGDAA